MPHAYIKAEYLSADGDGPASILFDDGSLGGIDDCEVIEAGLAAETLNRTADRLIERAADYQAWARRIAVEGRIVPDA